MAFLSHTTKMANPNGSRTRTTTTTRKRAKRKRVNRASNPGVVITLGAAALGLNPHKPNKKEVKIMKRKKANSRVIAPKRRTRKAKPVGVRRRATTTTTKRRRRRVANPTTQVVYRAKRKTNQRRRKNPNVFGTSITSAGGVKLVFAGLAGVAIARALPNIVRKFVTLPNTSWVNVLLAAVSAFAAGTLGTKFLGTSVGDGLMFGGLMEAGSSALTSVGVSSVGPYQLSLNGYGRSGLGVFHPASFPIPQMPVLAGGNGAPGPSTGAAIAAMTPGVAGFAPAFGR